ncbi:phosphatase PAP2 family protein [Solibacillus sp. FSL W7-1436]|uniref:phosphatase PAP2 family protein n=1 Tax=Solibacillus sp. FSL W7-1436 TaxID=2921705 RepID=UPI0030F5A779
MAICRAYRKGALFFIFRAYGETKFIFTVAIILCILIWLRKKDFRLIGFVIFSVGGGYGLYQLLKRLIERPRPDIADQFSTFSFPSGHAVHGLLYVFTIAYVLNRLYNFNKASLIVWIAAIILTLLIGLSRITEARHFASDVIAGWSLGYSWFIFIVWLYLKNKSTHSDS